MAYADDVDIIGRSICEVEAAFSKFAVNESKTKLLLSTAKDTRIGVSVEIDGYNFEVFVYLGLCIPRLQHKYRQRHQSGDQT